MEKVQKLWIYGNFHVKRECRRRGALKNIRNDNDYVCFWGR